MNSIRSSTRLSGTPSASSEARRNPQWAVAIIGGLAALALAIALAGESLRQSLLLLIGIGLGITLHHAAFGFTTAYRRLLFGRDASGVKAQLLMLACATLLFAPMLGYGTAFGLPVVGANASVGWQVAIGAFAFGIGMQLGGGCGSGTLYQVGGGSVRLVVTLLAFCAGGFWASLHMGMWQRLPEFGVIVLGERMGWGTAAATQLVLLCVLYFALRAIEHETPGVRPRAAFRWRQVLSGPWSLAVGAVLLALLNLATLIVAGHPWSITWGFTLWGAKAARIAGWNPTGDGFWSGDFQRNALDAPVLDDVTSVMNIGIVAGALMAAGFAGRFGPAARAPFRSFVGAALGGLLMGYGARIAYGCNIGAFFSGVASTSLHGWLWIAMALPGTWIGARMRPLFGVSS